MFLFRNVPFSCYSKVTLVDKSTTRGTIEISSRGAIFIWRLAPLSSGNRAEISPMKHDRSTELIGRTPKHRHHKWSLTHSYIYSTICKLALTVKFLTCRFTFQTPGLARQDYQVWLAIFFLIGWTNNCAPKCLASLFLTGNCLAKPGVWNVKQQEKMLNASLQMVVPVRKVFTYLFLPIGIS